MTSRRRVLQAAAVGLLAALRMPIGPQLIRRAPAPPRRRECVWHGAAKSDWADPRNWLHGQVPVDGDDVLLIGSTPAVVPPVALRRVAVAPHAEIVIGEGAQIEELSLYGGKATRSTAPFADLAAAAC